MRLLLTGFATGALLLSGCGLTAPRGSDGFADLDSLGMLDVDNTLTLSIGPTLLGFAARNTDGDPEARALLEGLDGVRVRLYEIDGDADRVARRVDHMGERARAQGWEPVAVVREGGETVHMLMRFDDNAETPRVAGLLVLVANRQEAVVVNVMGDLRPELFSDAMVALDVDVAPEVQLAAAP